MLPGIIYQNLKKDIGDVIRLANGIGRYNVDTESAELLDHWYQGREQSIFSRRLATYARRFMLLLAANDRRESIETDVTKNSIDLVEWQLQMRKLHDPIDAENKIALMELKIKRQLEAHGMMTQSKLMQKTNASRVGTWTFEKATEGLIRHGIISRFKRKTGKPERNPLMYELVQN